MSTATLFKNRRRSPVRRSEKESTREWSYRECYSTDRQGTLSHVGAGCHRLFTLCRQSLANERTTEEIAYHKRAPNTTQCCRQQAAVTCGVSILTGSRRCCRRHRLSRRAASCCRCFVTTAGDRRSNRGFHSTCSETAATVFKIQKKTSKQLNF